MADIRSRALGHCRDGRARDRITPNELARLLRRALHAEADDIHPDPLGEDKIRAGIEAALAPAKDTSAAVTTTPQEG